MSHVVTFDPAGPFLGRAAAAMGVFDGVHLGHQMLIRHAIAKSKDYDAVSCVVTFDCDPDCVVAPDRAARHLMTFSDRIGFLSAVGPDVVLVVPFDHALAALPADRFISDVLLRAVQPASITVGSDFRFGSRAAGTVATLRESARLTGTDVTAHELLNRGDLPVTATRIRALIAEGSVAEAAGLLGRPHFLRGVVERGRGVGVTLGAPTANLAIDRSMAIPGDGVYAGVGQVGSARYPAAVTIGRPPSFPDAEFLVEVHLIGYDGDLYGAPLTVEFHRRLRGLTRFIDLDELRRAIQADIRVVGELQLT